MHNYTLRTIPRQGRLYTVYSYVYIVYNSNIGEAVSVRRATRLLALSAPAPAPDHQLHRHHLLSPLCHDHLGHHCNITNHHYQCYMPDLTLLTLSHKIRYHRHFGHLCLIVIRIYNSIIIIIFLIIITIS